MENWLIPAIFIILFILAVCAEIAYYRNSFGILLSFEKGFKHMKLPVVKLRSGDTILNFLVDSGAQASYIDENILKLINVSKEPKAEGTVIGINNSSCRTGLCYITLQSMGYTMVFPMQTFDFKEVLCNDEDLTGGIIISGLLGSDFLQKYNGIIDYRHKLVKLCPRN